MNPTREEKAFWTRLADIVGCIACRLDGIKNHHVSIHHIDGRTKPGAHTKVLPLCDRHHQTGGEEAPSVHPWRARFEKKYGTQLDLLETCKQIISAEAHPKLQVTVPAKHRRMGDIAKAWEKDESRRKAMEEARQWVGETFHED